METDDFKKTMYEFRLRKVIGAMCDEAIERGFREVKASKNKDGDYEVRMRDIDGTWYVVTVNHYETL